MCGLRHSWGDHGIDMVYVHLVHIVMAYIVMACKIVACKYSPAKQDIHQCERQRDAPVVVHVRLAVRLGLQQEEKRQPGTSQHTRGRTHASTLANTGSHARVNTHGPSAREQRFVDESVSYTQFNITIYEAPPKV